VLRNGLNLVGADVYWQPAAIGFVIIMAIMLDRARSNPQVQAYFRQLEGRIAVASVLLATLVAFVGSLIYGLGADSMLTILLTLPFCAAVYFFFYKGIVAPIDTPWRRWTYAGLALLLSAVILLVMWAVVRVVALRLLQPRLKARGEETLQSASL
jgi:hypothetical protein